jgi:hypothetical protein
LLLLTRFAPLVAAVLALAGCGSSGSSKSTSSATTASQPPGQSAANTGGSLAPRVDAIPCTAEALQVHYHAHIWLLRDGRPVTVPAGIGINPEAGCLYYLHTHTPDGVIHIESPAQRPFSLGEFFDVWHQPLSNTQAATLSGPLRFFVGRRRITGDPRKLVLQPHMRIAIEQGRAVPPPAFTFPQGE